MRRRNATDRHTQGERRQIILCSRTRFVLEISNSLTTRSLGDRPLRSRCFRHCHGGIGRGSVHTPFIASRARCGPSGAPNYSQAGTGEKYWLGYRCRRPCGRPVGFRARPIEPIESGIALTISRIRSPMVPCCSIPSSLALQEPSSRRLMECHRTLLVRVIDRQVLVRLYGLRRRFTTARKKGSKQKRLGTHVR